MGGMQLLSDPNGLRGVGAGKKIGVLTSGGDAQGMNAALRAVVRTALFAGAQPYAICEGYQGMVDGGTGIRPLAWDDASGILNRGGTFIGTFRSKEFPTRAGMLKAAGNLVELGIDRLVVIGGDGSLTGLDEFARQWSSLLDELAGQGRTSAQVRQAYPRLVYAGLVGSIDNDLVGIDMTIGVDSALHRIQEAIDAIASTAASHQRCFVVEVMGRHCGYLALAAAISGGCDYVLVPEDPPSEGWERAMCEQLARSRGAGRKDSIVILAEGAMTRSGEDISAEYVRAAIEEHLGEEARVTILGHVQRGGTPSAYDRWTATWLGYEAASYVLTASGEAAGLTASGEAGPVFGIRGEQVVRLPLVEAVADTRRAHGLVARSGPGSVGQSGTGGTGPGSVGPSGTGGTGGAGPAGQTGDAGPGQSETGDAGPGQGEPGDAGPTGPVGTVPVGPRNPDLGRDPEALDAHNDNAVPVIPAPPTYREAVTLRGPEFADLLRIFGELSAPARTAWEPGDRRIAVMHAGALSPGMNTAVKTAVWLGISRGYRIVGIEDGFVGLAAGSLRDLTWGDVDGWSQEGGAVLGTRRHVPSVEELYATSRNLESHQIEGLLVVGGWSAYEGVRLMVAERTRYPGLQIPIVCVPATIDNNLPGTAMSVGADAALSVVVDCLDKLKMAASASQRCFVIETMGRDCGYLALMGGLAGGAEQVYLNETGITLDGLRADIDWLKHSFDNHGRSLFLAVRNENANPNYTTDVLAHLIDEEGRGRYDTRTLIIGHIQQGGTPTPADRLLATRLTDAAMTELACQMGSGGQSGVGSQGMSGGQVGPGGQGASCVGLFANEVHLTDIVEAMAGTDPAHQRATTPWWTGLKPVLDCLNREQ